MKTRTEIFVYNSTTIIVQRIIAMLAAFIIPRIIMTVYGSEINGFIVSVKQFVTYFYLVEAGISGASTVALYKPLADQNIPAINGVLSAAKKFYYQSGWAFVGLVALLAIFYPLFIKTNLLNFWQIFITVFALGATGVMDFFTLSKYRVLLSASQRIYVISFGRIIYSVLNVIITWVLAKAGCSVVTLQVALIFSVFARTALLQWYVRKNFPYVDYNAKPDNSSLKDRWNVLYLEVLSSLQTCLPIMLATLFTTLQEVSVYSIYALVLTGINSIMGIFSSGLYASFGDVIARKQQETLQKSTQEFEQAYYSMITIVYSTALFLIVPFVSLYTKGVNDVNYIIPSLGFMFVLNGLLYNIKTPQGMLVISAGMYRQTRWQNTIQAAIMAIVGLIGAKLWGLHGILFGVICSNFYRDIDLMFFIPKHLTHVSYKKTLKHGLAALATFGLVAGIWKTVPMQINSMTQWVCYAVIITIVISVWTIVLNYAIDRQNMKNVAARITGLVRKKLGKRR